MGAWGIGPYSSDFAQDLRPCVKAVARLPFSPDRLLELLCAAEPAAADDRNDSDHTIFWLTIADQFAQRGIDCARARDRALSIIADGSDLTAMAALGMDEKSLKKRRSMLEELRSRISRPADTSKRRAVIKAPQKLLLDVGDVLIYPICKGEPINPYAVGKDWAWVKAWKQDGWGAFVVVERGLAFDFLAWYRPLVITEPSSSEPSLANLLRPHMWLLRQPGTLTARHYNNMSLNPCGRVSIDVAKLDHFFPNRGSATNSVVKDISLCNAITVRSLGPHEVHRIKHGYPATLRINALQEIAPEDA
jgi:hypothetical protein